MNTSTLNSSPTSTSRVLLSRLAPPLGWFVVGFGLACACLASPGATWVSHGQASTVAAQAVQRSGAAEAPVSVAVSPIPEAEGPGGPGADDNTEWMPGNR